MKKIKDYFKYAIAAIGFILMCLGSCTPEKRLSRIIRKHPELVKSDTIFQTHYDTIPEIHISTVFQKDTNTKGLDSIFGMFRNQMDSTIASHLQTQVHNYIVNKPVFADTVTKVVDGVTVKLFSSKDDGSVGIIIFRPEEIKTEKQAIIINSVNPTAKESFWVQAKRIFSIIGILAIIFLLVVAGLKLAKWTAKKVP